MAQSQIAQRNDSPCYFTWAWKTEDGGELAASDQRFVNEQLCRAEGERQFPSYQIFDDEGKMNPVPELRITCHDLTKVFIELGENVRIHPCFYKREPRIDIRLWEMVQGVLRRSKRGVSLTPEQWKNLLLTKDVIGIRLDTIASRMQDVDCKFHLGGGHHVSLKSPFMAVDLRSWWCPEMTSFRPTTRGMRLTTNQWVALLKSEEKVSGTLSAMRDLM
jgi:hypothetical protein